MKRRNFLKLGAAGTAAAFAPGLSRAQAGGPIRLTIEPVDNEMIDGFVCYMWTFFRDGTEARPVIRLRQGDPVQIVVTNNDDLPHGFAVTGVPGAGIGSIAPGATASVSFTAPMAGSYLYYDPINDPVGRLLGLHGALIVRPKGLGLTPGGVPTPYRKASLTPAIISVFEAMGVPPAYPGNRWDPNDPERDKVWVMCQTDPALNAAIDDGQAVVGANVSSSFRPRYFTINWLSGFDTADHTETLEEARAAARSIMPSGRQGQPTLIRTLNAGLATHSLHIHGNHVFALTDVETTASQAIIFETNVLERDAWRLQPLDRRDVLLPFDRPRDIPVAAWPPRQEPFPLRYVMHCHTEMSQTAAGGNYPMGLVTHWEMTAPL